MATAFDDHAVPRHDVPTGGRSGFTVIDGRQVHYLEWGRRDSPPVVCLHGGGQTAYMYEDLGASLADRYHLLAPDLPAHGDSDAVAEMDRHEIAATLPPFFDQFGFDRPALVGASLGGIVSITLGASHPERVAAIALIDIGHQLEEEGVKKIIEFMRKHESFASLEEAADAIAEYLPHRKREDISPERLTRNLRRRDDGRWVWKHAYGRALRDNQDERARNWRSILDGLEHDGRNLRCPVLLLRGAKSDVLSDEGADAFVEIIPDARLAAVDAAGHLAAGDNPHSTVNLIADFLDEVHR